MVTAIPMEPERAARLIEKWINFYGMENPKAWPPEDYAYVKRASESMRLAIDILKGHTENKTAKEIAKAVNVIQEWPRMHSMNNPNMWEAEDFPFVRNALDALMFAVSFLKEHQASQ